MGILLDTGTEVLNGSKRLKAGNTQKLALKRITTAAMVLDGRVAENHMIEMNGSNQKLRRRACALSWTSVASARAKLRNGYAAQAGPYAPRWDVNRHWHVASRESGCALQRRRESGLSGVGEDEAGAAAGGAGPWPTGSQPSRW